MSRSMLDKVIIAISGDKKYMDEIDSFISKYDRIFISILPNNFQGLESIHEEFLSEWNRFSRLHQQKFQKYDSDLFELVRSRLQKIEDLLKQRIVYFDLMKAKAIEQEKLRQEQIKRESEEKSKIEYEARIMRLAEMKQHEAEMEENRIKETKEKAILEQKLWEETESNQKIYREFCKKHSNVFSTFYDSEPLKKLKDVSGFLRQYEMLDICIKNIINSNYPNFIIRLMTSSYGIIHNKKIRNNFDSHPYINVNDIVFHDLFGEGNVQKIDDSYINIVFSGQIMQFPFPSSIGKTIFTDATNRIKKRQKFLLQIPDDALVEKKHFDEIVKIVSAKKTEYETNQDMARYFMNDYERIASGEGQVVYNEIIFTNRQIELIERTLLQPYFARIDYVANPLEVNTKVIYIGKNAIPGHVVGWHEDVAAMYYYFYNFLKDSSKEEQLKLLRDFDIAQGQLYSFSDKINNFQVNLDEYQEGIVISDERLIQILKDKRHEKETSDIITSIRINQYRIITSDINHSIIVEGCPGSGKTMILLHRLSFHFLRKSLPMVLNDTYILTPSKLLKSQLSSLSPGLDLYESNRLSVIEFYLRIYADTCSEFNIFRANCTEIYDTNYILDDENIIFLYSNEYINLMTKKVLNLMNFQNCSTFECNLDSRVLNEYAEFSKYRSAKQNFVDIDILYSQLREELSKFSYNRISHYINHHKKIIRQWDLRDQALKSRDILILKKIEIEQKGMADHGNEDYTLNNQYLDVINKLQETEKYIEILSSELKAISEVEVNSVRKKIEVISRYISEEYKRYFNTDFDEMIEEEQIISDFIRFNESYSVGKTKSSIDFVKSYDTFSSTSIFRMWKKYFTRVKDVEIIDLMIEFELFQTKLQYKLDVNLHYEFEAFIRDEIFLNLSLLKRYPNSLIFIDEFQDYSLLELKFIKSAFPISTVNLFGDYDQQINPKGISREDVDLVFSNLNSYQLNENYRNSYEITNYINNRFQKTMTPIGLSGKVENCTFMRFFEKTQNNHDDRIALIVANVSCIIDFENKYVSATTSDHLNVIRSSNQPFIIGQINVIPVFLAKGMEFDIVGIIEEQMSSKQLFVSMTRALSELYLIDKS